MLGLFGSIMLIGGAIALLERWLLGRNWLWVLPALTLAAAYSGVQLVPGPCGTPEAILLFVLFFSLGGYVCVCAIRATINHFRSAA